MKVNLLRIIYPLVLILYIFVLNTLPLGFINESVVQSEVKTEVTLKPKYNIETFSQILGVTKRQSQIVDEQFSIHQYDQKRFGDQGTKDFSDIDRNVTESEISSYSYHQNNYNKKEVIGFLPYWSLSIYQGIDYGKLSTLAYFALTSDETGAWVHDSGYDGFYSTSFDNMVAMAHAKGTKVVLVAKNFDPYSIRRIITNTGSAGDRMINNIVRTIRDNGLDGVNVDFEYVVKKSEDTITDQLRKDFASWHRKLADAVHSEFPKAHVSTDTFGGSAVYYNLYDISALNKSNLDFIVMMTYDYITTSCINGKIVTPMSPLYGNDGYNISSHLLAATQKASSKKIIMGVPYYGIDFEVKASDKNTYNARVNYPHCDGTIESYSSITNPIYDQYHNANTIKWNSAEKATWYAYSINGTYRQGYYDDAKSLGFKYDFVNSNNLGGIAVWALGYDNNAKELYNVMRDKFQKSPFYIHFGYGVTQEKINSIINSNQLTIESEVGNNVYLVMPNSELSETVMKRIKVYNEVIDVRFDLDGMARGLN